MTLIARHGPAWTRNDYHQFFLMQPEHQDFVPEEAGRLISPTREAVIVQTGIAGGNVAVHIEIHDHEPSLLMVHCLMDDPPDLPVLTPAPAGPGLYRVRPPARGRDIAYDLSE
ncbi:hypothetical protein [Actinomadura bangladeshensis]|uniref:Uncharacterized protein n=1 Tax=Actinomadura bangladeshensis TaxID=453573 RepID=A0A4R4N8J7_9ACTN|nr:hypothetical protein [Actinomadura bangladeshensis]TDC05261.1 hypothetical protein E1284_35710 [Actinomadura bangladeshensis]